MFQVPVREVGEKQSKQSEAFLAIGWSDFVFCIC